LRRPSFPDREIAPPAASRPGVAAAARVPAPSLAARGGRVAPVASPAAGGISAGDITGDGIAASGITAGGGMAALPGGGR